MDEKLIFHDDSKTYQAELEHYWQNKRGRIERLLKRIPEDQRQLRINFWHRAPRWDTRLVLMLPTGTLVGEAEIEGKGYPPSVDEAVDRLVERIRRHKETLRRHNKRFRRQQREEDLVAVAPHLTTSRKQQREAAFLDLLRPSMRTLREQIRRELIIAQLDGRLYPGELTVSDVFDEAALEAWRRYDERPAEGPFDQWLMELCYEVLDRMIEQAPSADSIEQPVPEDDPRYRAEVGWLADNNPFWEPGPPLTMSELLPDEETPESWQPLAEAQEEKRVMDLLQDLPARHRRAFTLHAIEGWEDHEIAALMDCDVDQARRLIEESRNGLRQSLEQDRTPVHESG